MTDDGTVHITEFSLFNPLGDFRTQTNCGSGAEIRSEILFGWKSKIGNWKSKVGMLKVQYEKI
jgi:hypothetical protein